MEKCIALLMVSLTACQPDAPSGEDVLTDNETAADSAGADSAAADSAGADSGAGCDPLIVSSSVGANPFSAPGAVVSLETCASSVAVVEFWRAGGAVHRSRPSAPGTTHRLAAIGMRADTDYQLRPVVTGPGGAVVEGDTFTFRSPPAPEGISPWTFTLYEPHRPRAGHVIFGPGPDSRDAYLVGFDGEGFLTWYYHDPALDDLFEADRQVRQLDSGDLLVSIPVGWRIISPAGQTLREIAYPDLGLEVAHHDVAPLPDGGLLILSGESRWVEVKGEEVKVFGDTVVDVSAEGVIRSTWSTFDHLDTERFPGASALNESSNGSGLDWTHANAVEYEASDDSFLLSLRNQSWVIKVDRASGEVLWRLGADGDFALASGEWFFSQHAPEIADDGTLLLYDNGNERGVALYERYSRAVRYALDEETMTATQVWEFIAPQFNGTMGDANTLPGGEVLVCTAGNLHYPVFPVLITEVDGVTSKPIWELEMEGVQIYRTNWVYEF